MRIIIHSEKREQGQGLGFYSKKTEGKVCKSRVDIPECGIYIDGTKLKKIDQFKYV